MTFPSPIQSCKLSFILQYHLSLSEAYPRCTQLRIILTYFESRKLPETRPETRNPTITYRGCLWSCLCFGLCSARLQLSQELALADVSSFVPHTVLDIISMSLEEMRLQVMESLCEIRTLTLEGKEVVSTPGPPAPRPSS